MVQKFGAGQLFLDEIGEIGPNVQVKLLRAIETGEYTPVGDTKVRISDVRIISATNRNLADMVTSGLMREDFFYRITVIPITLPPLRERREDIPLLVEHFLRMFSKGKSVPGITGAMMDRLQRYDWPGNVRELQNVLQRYVSMGRLDPIDSREALNNGMGFPAMETDHAGEDLNAALKNFEKKLIQGALRETQGNKTKAAFLLGIDRRSLLRKMRRVEAH